MCGSRFHILAGLVKLIEPCRLKIGEGARCLPPFLFGPQTTIVRFIGKVM